MATPATPFNTSPPPLARIVTFSSRAKPLAARSTSCFQHAANTSVINQLLNFFFFGSSGPRKRLGEKFAHASPSNRQQLARPFASASFSLLNTPPKDAFRLPIAPSVSKLAPCHFHHPAPGWAKFPWLLCFLVSLFLIPSMFTTKTTLFSSVRCLFFTKRDDNLFSSLFAFSFSFFLSFLSLAVFPNAFAHDFQPFFSTGKPNAPQFHAHAV